MQKKRICVKFLATRGSVVLAENIHIIPGRLIQSFRHLKHQNWFIISDLIIENGQFP